MATATFHARPIASMDLVSQSLNVENQWDVGGFYFGGTKTQFRRVIVDFDVFGPAAAGRPLTAADVITAAEIQQTVDLIQGAGFLCELDRITRADWDYTEMSWNNYRAATAWTVGGGDVATPPAKLEFSAPTATGAFVLAGLADWVTDAIGNRNGRVILRLKAKNEDPGFATWWAALDGNNLDTDLVVTYEGADIAPIDDPSRGGAIIAPGQPLRAQRIASSAPPQRSIAPTTPARPAHPGAPRPHATLGRRTGLAQRHQDGRGAPLKEIISNGR